MPFVGRLCVALAAPLLLSAAAAAEAQVSGSDLVAPVEAGVGIVPAQSGLPDFRMPRGDFRARPGPARNGLIGTVPLRRNLHIGVGRFAVPNFSAPRVESAEIRRRDGGIAAVGLGLRF